MSLKRYLSGLKLNVKFTLLTVAAVVLPIAVLAGVLFYNMEQHVISEEKNYMEYKMGQSASKITTCIDTINMSTQFFLSDDYMTEVLNRARVGDPLNTQELLDFQERDITNLERLVNNNPLLYSVRVYSVNDSVQEMMPILYNASRMNKLSWSNEPEIEGWHYGYTDTAFSALITQQQQQLMCLVTDVRDYQNGEIGVIEAAIDMKTMFPTLYENMEDEWGYFVTDSKNIFYGNSKPEGAEDLAQDVLGRMPEDLPGEGITVFTSIGKKKLMVTYLPCKELKGTLVDINDITEDVHHVYGMRDIFILVMVGVLILLALCINWIVKRMLKQFYVIIKNIHQVQAGNLDVRIEKYTNDEMGALGIQLNKMLDRIQELMQENIDREVLVKNSEIRALQNQINAHFIYNVLESVKMMAEIDEEYEISDAITSLGKLLRYSMRWVSGNVKVNEELEYIKNYMALINLRYDFEVHLSINLDDALMDQEIPKMSLQPIVENAILHGIEPLGEESTIYIKGWVDDDTTFIEITDAGQGMSDEELEKLLEKLEGHIDTAGGRRGGIGLKNVQDRVRMAFGKEYGITVSTKKNCYTKVAIKMPFSHGL